ncbi:hypothetical protein GR255_26950, partial [Mycobacterium tuberculosis]|nr:hypothetical protein [Mycobacterium tuberculosis]
TVAGVPGSGKTAGLTSFLLPVALSEDVELNIIDGKGGHDWAAYKPICAYYSNDDEDLQAMKDYLEAAVEDMRERVQTMPAKLGVANFWSASIDSCGRTRFRQDSWLNLVPASCGSLRRC